MTHANKTPKLLARPEPDFVEGRRWPLAGWLGRVLWCFVALFLFVALAGAVVVAMVVQVPVTGVVTAGSPTEVSFLVADRAETMQVGLPGRVQGDDRELWALIEKVKWETNASGQSFARVAATVIDGGRMHGLVIGQSCLARILVGKPRTITGRWRVATSQVLRVDRGDVKEMQAYVPPAWRGGLKK